MRRLVPIRGSVLCRKVDGGEFSDLTKGLSVKNKKVDVYQILSLPEVVPDGGFEFKVGDLVMSNSTGDEIEVNPGDTVHLFKLENIMCRIDEDAQEEEKDR